MLCDCNAGARRLQAAASAESRGNAGSRPWASRDRIGAACLLLPPGWRRPHEDATDDDVRGMVADWVERFYEGYRKHRRESRADYDPQKELF